MQQLLCLLKKTSSFYFFGRSEAAIQAGHEFWQRRHERKNQDPASSVEVMQAQIEANMHFFT